MRARPGLQARVLRSFSDEARAEDLYWAALTPAERMGMMWQLAVDAWHFMGERVAESRLPRHVVRSQRRRR
jgi:hypothetical protein